MTPATASIAAALAAAAAGVGLAGATAPTMLGQLGPGVWELSRSADGARPLRLCIADPIRLAQLEHRGARCARSVIDDRADEARIHYRCAGGGFGETRMQMLTPRSLRLDTQGIKDGYPFSYVVHARRVGDCAAVKQSFNKHRL